MELVYLWVEDYKNIRKQGFNFSPRFEFDYNEDTKELTKLRDDSETYTSIFPENINITAIVGENGSGKSSLLTGITNDKILVEKNGKPCSNDFKDDKLNSLDRDKDYEIVYLDFDLIKINPLRDYGDYFNLNIFDRNLYKKTENNTAGSLDFNIAKFRENFFNLILEYESTFNLNLFSYNPKKIILSDYVHQTNFEGDKWERNDKLIDSFQLSNLTKEKFLLYLLNNINHSSPLDFVTIETKEELLLQEKQILKDVEFLKINDNDVEKIYKLFSFLLDKYPKEVEFDLEVFREIYIKFKEAFLKLLKIGYLQIDFKDTEEREYFDLSQGERKFFAESLMIFDAISKTEKDNIFLVLDEPDLTLHPDWQKMYINELIKLISNFTAKNFHVIITSHSPFILSDLPKENVIFLKNGRQFDVDIDTFGANIHTLLSHGFFMEDGLMGEFAKEKIKNIIDYHEELLSKELDKKEHKQIKLQEKDKYKKEKKEQFWQIQKIIGDDYLKQVVKNHIVEIEKILLGNDEAKKEEIKRLRKEISILEGIDA